MFGSILNTLTGGKDALISGGLKPAIDNYLDGAGKTHEVEINTAAKTAKCTLSMDGESRLLEIHVQKYSIQPGESGAEVWIEEWNSPSHPWLSTLGKKFLPKIKFKLPVPYAAANLTRIFHTWN